MDNKFPIIEFHILQSFPVSCLNRDDVGAPKSCIIGGVTRARVSSQCWKRAVRLSLHNQGITLGIRTKKVETHLKQLLLSAGQTEEVAGALATSIASKLTDDSLLFLTDKEYELLVKYAASIEFDPSKVNDKSVQKCIKKAIVSGVDGLDIALFGRMVAKVASMNVEAAACFSHAFSTHAVNSEIDFFTALDDESSEPGSAHMGASEFSSATYYRYISLNVRQLADTLGTDDINQLRAAISAFIKALYLAVPEARQTTMSASCLWDFARVYIRNGQRIQCSFDTPIQNQSKGGYLQNSISYLREDLDRKEKQAGSLFGLIDKIEFGNNDISIDDVVNFVNKNIV